MTKQEIYSEIARFASGSPAELGPGSKEQLEVLALAAEKVGIISNGKTKKALLEELVERAGVQNRLRPSCYSEGSTITTE